MAGSIRIPTARPAADLRGEQPVRAERHGSTAGDDPFDLDRVAVLRPRDRRISRRDGALGT